jgi:hypothetical protein
MDAGNCVAVKHASDTAIFKCSNQYGSFFRIAAGANTHEACHDEGHLTLNFRLKTNHVIILISFPPRRNNSQIAHFHPLFLGDFCATFFMQRYVHSYFILNAHLIASFISIFLHTPIHFVFSLSRDCKCVKFLPPFFASI